MSSCGFKWKSCARLSGPGTSRSFPSLALNLHRFTLHSSSTHRCVLVCISKTKGQARVFRGCVEKFDCLVCVQRQKLTWAKEVCGWLRALYKGPSFLIIKQKDSVSAHGAFVSLSKIGRAGGGSEHSSQEKKLSVKNIQEFHLRRQKQRRGQKRSSKKLHGM